MLGITLVTGVSQEQFEIWSPVATMGPALARSLPVLKALMSTDALFLCCYTLFFMVFAREAQGGDRLLLTWGVAAIALTAFLDIIEDHHILAMASAAADGIFPSAEAVQFQQLESQTKFNVSYFGLLAYGLGLPRRNFFEKAFSAAIAFPLPLLGVSIWALPASFTPALSLVRLAFFISGFVVAFFVSPKR